MVGGYDVRDVLIAEKILPFNLLEILFAAGIDEQHVIRHFAFFEHKDADANACREKQVWWQSDYRVYIAVIKELFANFCLGTATKEDTVRQDDRHSTFATEEVKSVQ